jgi:hypothetical protein
VKRGDERWWHDAIAVTLAALALAVGLALLVDTVWGGDW